MNKTEEQTTIRQQLFIKKNKRLSSTKRKAFAIFKL